MAWHFFFRAAAGLAAFSFYAAGSIGPAEAARLCFCSKADIGRPSNIAIQRCGRLIAYNAGPRGSYIIDEEGRGESTLDADKYQECETYADPICPVVAPPRPAPPPLKHQDQTDAFCPVTPEREQESFGIHGSNTIGEKLMPRLIAEYAKELRLEAKGEGCNGEIAIFDRRNPTRAALSIDCQAKGTETGIAALVDERADVAMLSRPITQNEVALMRQKGFPGMTTALHEHVLALDALAIIVSKDSVFRNSREGSLSLDEVADIFSQSDRATTWSGFGGAADPIRLYIRDEKSGTRESFEEMVMAPKRKKLPPCGQANVKCFSSSSALASAVASDPQGIGFVGYAYGRNVQRIPIAGQCGLKHVPDQFDIKTEDYLLSRRLFLYTAKLHSIHAPNFITYALSHGAQATIADVGYVDQRIETESAGDTEERVARYKASFPHEAGLDFDEQAMRALRADVSKAQRLSISFRFRFNSTMLDTKALQDVNRLADHLTFTAKRGKVMLLGFTDSEGDFKVNLQLARARAKAVENALLAGGVPADRIVSNGYGELMPVACNTRGGGDAYEEGRSKNRRVEAWLLP
jgi:phosphate transport system substrate-binding protein